MSKEDIDTNWRIGKEYLDRELDDWCTDARALIASGKTQRWEVVKWATVVNLALASVAATKDRAALLPNAFWFSLLVAVVALILIVLATKRINGARKRLERINVWIAKNSGSIVDVRRDVLQEQKPDLSILGPAAGVGELIAYSVALFLPTAFLLWR